VVFAALSWLGLVSGANTLSAQTPSKSDTAKPASADAIAALLSRLDACFQRGDVAGYLAMFEPDHPGAHAMLQHSLQRLFPASTPVARTSTIVAEPRVIGPRTVVRVRHDVRVTNADAKSFTAYREDTMLVLRTDRGDQPVPTCSLEIPLDVYCVANDHFRCPPCNYEIGGVPGWLCVPLRSDRAQALEAASFYLIGTDLACDISVQVDPLSPPAQEVARQLGAALHGLDASAKPGLAEPWWPPAHAKDKPKGLCGARLEIDLPLDFADGGGGNAVFHVVAFGSLQHLLLVRGSRKSLRVHADSLQALLDSYRLIVLDADIADASAQSLAHHIGGSFRGNLYCNSIYRVEMLGPDGWQAQQRPGGTAFRANWTSPHGSRLWITGYVVPPSMSRWCQKTADRFFQKLCDKAGLVPCADQQAWIDVRDSGGPMRSVACTSKSPAQGGSHQRLARLLVCDDLLVIADGCIATDADAPAVKAALDSLRRK
jgi:hypothetical protein